MITNEAEATDYNQLWRSRITERCGGSKFDIAGTGYSFSNVLAEERALKAFNRPGEPDSALCCLSIADPTWKMPGDAMLAGMRYYLTNNGATRYTDNNGIDGTHQAIADYLNRYTSNFEGAIEFTPDWVQYSPGSIKRLLAEYLPSVLFDDNTQVFFPSPGYGVIKSSINLRGAKAVDVPMLLSGGSHGRWNIDYYAIELKLKKGCKHVLYLNMPHNPTGSAYGEPDWEDVIRWALKHGVILIIDEAYTDLRFDSESTSILNVPGWQECCIILQSVSKGWNATGLRFGWAIAHPTFIKALRGVMDVKDSGLFGPNIAAGLWCLEHRDFADITCDGYENLHTDLHSGLREAGFDSKMPDAGLCQFTPAPRGAHGIAFKSSVECVQWIRQHLRVSLMNYEVNKQPYLRWAVTIAPVPECGLKDESAVIREVVRRLQTAQFEF